MKKFYFLVLLSAFLFTQTASAQILLSEGFEGATFPPAGWTRINAGSGNDWKSGTDASLNYDPYPAHSGTGSMVYEYNSTNAANAWMITPGVSLTAGTQYTISFFYRVASASYPEKLKVTVGTAATVAAQSTVLWDNAGGTSLTNTSYAPATITYTPPSSGTYYFGFNAYSAANQFSIMVDDVSVEVTPSSAPTCTTNTSPSNNATGVAYIPYINLSWAPAAGATSYDLYIGTTTSPSYLLNTAGTSISLSGGAANTTYYWYVVPRNAAGIPSGCNTSMTAFTTGPVPPAPSNDDCAGAIALTPYMGGPYNATSISATASTGTTSCGSTTTWGTPDDDVWFKFTAVQGGNASITIVGGPTFDAVMQVYTGACGSLTQFGTCYDVAGTAGTETLPLTGLVAGTTYYLRVYDWTAGAGDNFTIAVSGTALPVTVSDFSGQNATGYNRLNWTTATESNNRGFELERSADGKNFSSIAFIATRSENGNSASALNYNYNDVRPLNGTNYYRLKQIDKDGKFTYSNVVVLKSKISDIRFSSVYPNPASRELKLVISSPSAEKITLIVTDLTGKILIQQSTQVVIGDNQTQLNIQSLATGSYLIKAICASGCETTVQRFVKQ